MPERDEAKFLTFVKQAICINYIKISLSKHYKKQVYHKRQLSLYAFNVHVLSNGKNVF